MNAHLVSGTREAATRPGTRQSGTGPGTHESCTGPDTHESDTGPGTERVSSRSGGQRLYKVSRVGPGIEELGLTWGLPKAALDWEQ